MSRYGAGAYGVSLYGINPQQEFSVEPMSIKVLNFSEVYVTWFQPKGTFSKFRLVRNQTQFPETAEDGIIIFEQSSGDGSSLEGIVSTTEFTDGLDNPNDTALTKGSQVYYSVFLFNTEKVWVRAGSISDVIPFYTNAITKTLNIFPRVMVSEQVAPLGTVSDASPIYKILDAFSFTYEQFLTFLTLLRPEHRRDKTLYSTIPGESLNLGLEIEPNLPVINQHRLIREAIYLYKSKGTKLGIEGYAEALTGYIPTATVSNNLLLNVQDSTFYKGKGNWVATNATLTSSTDLAASSGTNVIDTVYTGKIVATNSGVMSLGATSPKTKGTAVRAGTQYTASCKIKSPTSAGNITLKVIYYDRDGVALSDYSSSATAADNTWKTVSVTSTSDSDASYATLEAAYSAAGTYYVDQFCLQTGASVSYDEARAITLTLIPRLENKIKNPSFESNSNTWTVTGATFSKDTSVSPDAYSGSFSGKFVAAGSWSLKTDYNIPVDKGNYFTTSFYAKSSDIANLTLTIKTYDNTDVLVNTYTQSFALTSSWTRYSLSELVGTDSTESYAKLEITAGAGTAYIDMVQVEQTYKATDYFDGSMPTEYGAIWAGTPNESESYLYTSKLTKIPRLAYTLNDWVPFNSFWRVNTASGVVYTNLDV